MTNNISTAKAQSLLNNLLAKQDLSVADAKAMMVSFMSNNLSNELVAALLIALRCKGESVDEIVGCAQAMREFMQPVNIGQKNVVELVGTGGDGSKLFNVSTISSFVAMAAGATVAKHFNRSNSSASGGADFLENVGANINLTHKMVEQSLKNLNIGFMFAPLFHSAMKFVVPIRKQLATRTIFNFLGPLSNPAGTKRVILGVFHKDWQMPMAQALCTLGCDYAWIVHTAGTDELMVNSPNHILEVRNNKITPFTLDATKMGLKEQPLEKLQANTAQQSVDIINNILKGDSSAAGFATVVLNTAAALVVSEVSPNIEEAILLAKNTLSNGNAQRSLQKYIDYSKTLS